MKHSTVRIAAVLLGLSSAPLAHAAPNPGCPGYPNNEAWLSCYGTQCSAGACVGDAAQLNKCRTERTCKGWGMTTTTTLGGPEFTGGSAAIPRYTYTYCNGATAGCSPWTCSNGTWTRNTSCQLVTQDNELVSEGQCVLANNSVWNQANACKTALTNTPLSNIAAGIPVLPEGNTASASYYSTSNPCTAALQSTLNLPMGIGDEYTVGATVPASNYSTTNLCVNSAFRIGGKSEVMYFTPGQGKAWSEMYVQEKDWSQQVQTWYNYPLLPFPPAPTPPYSIDLVLCQPDRASLFTQGFKNAPGSSNTATGGNIDNTTSNGTAPANGNPVMGLIGDTQQAYEYLHGTKTVATCNAMQTAWNNSCASLPDGTFSHSLGAIGTRVYGLTTTLNVGSVDNVPPSTASFVNNCDPAPAVTQLGLELIYGGFPLPGGGMTAGFPTNEDATNFPCPGASGGCVQRNANGNFWIQPVTNPTSPDGTLVKWCAGRPGVPSNQMFSGRSTLQDYLVNNGNQLCPSIASFVQQVWDSCVNSAILAGSIYQILECVGKAYQAVAGTIDFASDHYLLGNGSVPYNAYQVLGGLDNLGRIDEPWNVQSAYWSNPAPSDTPPSCPKLRELNAGVVPDYAVTCCGHCRREQGEAHECHRWFDE